MQPPVSSRKEFVDLFESSLLRAHELLLEERALQFEFNLPKTYLVEFHPVGGISPSTDLLEKRLAHLSERLHFRAIRIADDLFQVSAPKLSLVVDAANPRFTLFHTLTDSVTADAFVFRHFVSKTPAFDQVWFSPEFLERYAAGVTVEGWGARFTPFVERREVEDVTYSPKRVRVEIDEPGAWDRFVHFRTSSDFAHLPLDVVRVRSGGDGRVGRARVSSGGKLTARGNSFLHYQQLAIGLRDEYARDIASLETRYRVLFPPERTDRVAMRGEPYWIEFPKSLEDFEPLLGRMFSGTIPFRLVGFLEQPRPRFFRIHAVDLHIATRLYVEATPRWLRVFLPEHGCGNSLVRIVRSLQYNVTDKLGLPINA